MCLALGTWGARRLELSPEHLDPYAVLWAMCRSADPAALPDHRVVVRLDFPALPRPNRFWLLYEHGRAEVCAHSPGGDEDLVVVADPAAFTQWHMGWTTWTQAVRAGHIAVTGPRELARAFPTWSPHSRFAEVRPEPDVLAAAPAAQPSPAAGRHPGSQNPCKLLIISRRTLTAHQLCHHLRLVTRSLMAPGVEGARTSARAPGRLTGGWRFPAATSCGHRRRWSPSGRCIPAACGRRRSGRHPQPPGGM